MRVADIEENIRRLNKAVEDIVRRFPEQFLRTHALPRPTDKRHALRICLVLNPRVPLYPSIQAPSRFSGQRKTALEEIRTIGASCNDDCLMAY
jgi:hypothetical protein